MRSLPGSVEFAFWLVIAALVSSKALFAAITTPFLLGDSRYYVEFSGSIAAALAIVLAVILFRYLIGDWPIAVLKQVRDSLYARMQAAESIDLGPIRTVIKEPAAVASDNPSNPATLRGGILTSCRGQRTN